MCGAPVALLAVVFLGCSHATFLKGGRTYTAGLLTSPPAQHMPQQCSPTFDAPYGTNCPHTVWVDAMVAADPTPGKVIMDIGCNKGNSAMKWMERWDMSGFWSTSKWMDFYSQRGVANYACPGATPHVGKLAREVTPHGDKTLVPKGLCVEPMQINVDLLLQARKTLGYEPNQTTAHGAFHVVQAAVLDKAGANETILFPDGYAGQEDVGLQSFHETEVPLKTVDGIVHEYDLPRVDILLVDTEGADPAVIRGASKALSSVRYLEFEVHRDLEKTEWSKVMLGEVVHELDQVGFACYWTGNNGRLLSMNKCWSPYFERGAWSNAACVKRNDVWYKVLEGFSDFNK